jgi:hypothetical protein
MLAVRKWRGRAWVGIQREFGKVRRRGLRRLVVLRFGTEVDREEWRVHLGLWKGGAVGELGRWECRALNVLLVVGLRNEIGGIKTRRETRRGEQMRGRTGAVGSHKGSALTIRAMIERYRVATDCSCTYLPKSLPRQTGYGSDAGPPYRSLLQGGYDTWSTRLIGVPQAFGFFDCIWRIPYCS